MSTAARIVELLGKFDENPRRYFAPLANEYRKAGDLAQAIAICREHLPKQPGHMSGHIVFGQALYESGEVDEAQEVFEAALTLDPENLIALRHLGDIARVRGDAVGARRWYGRVLDADPRNDDIAALIAALPARVTPAASTAIEEPTLASTNPPAAVETAGSVVDEPAWHTPAFLKSETAMPSAAMPSAATEDTESPSERPPVELLDLDAPIGEPTPAHAEETPPVEGFAATHDDAARHVGDDGLALALASLVAPAPGADVIDVALDAFASHDPLDLDVGALTDEMIDAVSSSVASVAPTSPPLESVPTAVDVPADAADTADGELPEAEEPALAVPEQLEDEAVGGRALAMDALAEPSVPDETTAAFEEGLLAEEWPSPESIHSRPRTSAGVPVEVPQADSVAMPSETVPPVAETDLVPSALDVDAIETVGDDAVAEATVAAHEVELATFDIEAEVEAHAVATGTPEAHPEGDSEDTVDWTTSTDALEALETEAAFAASPVSPVDEDLPLSAAEMPWMSVAEDEREAELDVIAPSSDEPVFDAGATLVGDVRQDEAADITAVADEAAPVESDTTGGFVTETMAELLVAQGFAARAIGVYEELVRRRPYDGALAGRLADLRAQATTAEAEADIADALLPDALVADAEADIADAPLAEAPIGTTAFSATPASLTPLGLGAIVGTPRSVPLVAPAASRTARDWLASVAARRVQRPTPSAAPRLAASLTPSLGAPGLGAPGLGAPAASVLGTPADGLASLFGETDPPAAADVQAATSLASAFGGAAPAGARDLFDDLGASSDVEPAAPVDAPAIVPDTGETFSFDRFFPDPARTPDSASSAVEVAPSLAGTGARPSGATPPINPTQELAQFANWLKGLSNP